MWPNKKNGQKKLASRAPRCGWLIHRERFQLPQSVRPVKCQRPGLALSRFTVTAEPVMMTPERSLCSLLRFITCQVHRIHDTAETHGAPQPRRWVMRIAGVFLSPCTPLRLSLHCSPLLRMNEWRSLCEGREGSKNLHNWPETRALFGIQPASGVRLLHCKFAISYYTVQKESPSLVHAWAHILCPILLYKRFSPGN
jgi:hypothetical protein